MAGSCGVVAVRLLGTKVRWKGGGGGLLVSEIQADSYFPFGNVAATGVRMVVPSARSTGVDACKKTGFESDIPPRVFFFFFRLKKFDLNSMSVGRVSIHLCEEPRRTYYGQGRQLDAFSPTCKIQLSREIRG